MHENLNGEQVYLPALKRLILLKFGFPVAGCFIGLLLSGLQDYLAGGDPVWVARWEPVGSLIIIGGIFAFLVIGLNRDWDAIKIDARSISRPAAMGGRKTLLLDEIDYKKTARGGGSGWLLRGQRVWDRSGDSIAISIWYFSAEQIKQILAAIGCRESTNS